jgi:hypothetical protein
VLRYRQKQVDKRFKQDSFFPFTEKFLGCFVSLFIVCLALYVLYPLMRLPVLQFQNHCSKGIMYIDVWEQSNEEDIFCVMSSDW